MLKDEETAELLWDRAATDQPTTMDTVGWTPERELLTTIVDVLSEMHATLIQVNTKDGKRPPVERMSRPTSIFEKIEHKQAVEAHRERVRKLIGG
jgi:vacuolar-type H+-ATPase subunit I/STV1